MIRPTVYSDRRSSQRAMTLVEVIVAGSVLLVVLGIAMGMMIETQRATQGISRRQIGLQNAQQGMRRILGALNLAIARPNVASAQGGNIFAANRLVFHAFLEDTGVNRLTISGGAMPEIEGEPVISGAEEHFSYELLFAYADAPAPGTAPDYRDNWPADDWPDLVRVTLRGESPEPNMRPIVLETSVIPGLLSGEPSAAPAVTSAMTLQDATSPTLRQEAPR